MDTSRSAMQKVINGFRLSQLVSVAAALGIADRLASGPKSVQALAAATGAHEDALYRVLRTLASFEIFEERADDNGAPAFRLTDAGEWLRSDVAGSLRVAAEVAGADWMWNAWGGLLRSVMTNETAFDAIYGQSTWTWFDAHPAAAALFNRHMEALTAADARAIVEAFDFSRFGTIVDVAGGQGALLAAIVGRHAGARGVLFNLERVVAAARDQLPPEVADRVELVAGDFFASVPRGGDAYILKNILHDWADEPARAILRVCRRDMPPHAALLIVERLVGPPNDGFDGKLADIQMMVRNGGRNRTEREFRLLLAACGFAAARVVHAAGGPSIIEAAVN